jgi:hypothetical protein
MAQKAKSKTKAKTNRSTGVSKAAPRIKESADWRKQTLDHMRKLILAADPEMTEEQKWRKPSNPAGVPVWSHHGMVCTGETYKNVVKLTFAHGASLPDPTGVFNAGLAGNQRRAIDIHEGETVDAIAFKSLIRAAIARNATVAKKR